jgi:hypothetical protein
LSFTNLAKRYSGDQHNFKSILNELLDSKAVVSHGDGTIEAVRRSCVNVGWDPDGISALGEELAEHFETGLYNLKNPDNPRLSHRVVCSHLDADAARVVIPGLSEEVKLLMEGAQDTLLHPKHLARSKIARAKARKFAIAVYFFQEPSSENQPRPRLRTSREGLRQRHKRKTVKVPSGGGAP